ncbi:hypothetical protein FOMG_18875 [Fusarium oxysporum f. sp. melonis 26406]|uniref:Carboxylic ester hydrolase n=1 Tax=Fusarium oxysporum f. sp. melonis 26406 TaxID=1089452 RepID=W9Z6Z3_FUSOX|nr:hypothetical protein FOMG_18875 [Fusarium oxysporum f. sp. melonis 26406]KAJ9413311.1 Alpha/Beta hydrolase protein [Fusarium oxysporum]
MTGLKPSKINFEHRRLGQLIGWTRGHDIVQFRGVPYATIPGRFRQSALLSDLPTHPFAATNPGPTCPHPEQPYFEYWEGPLPDEYPDIEPPKTSELECLNLSLTVPRSCVEDPNRKVPVLVFIHGGAFVGGSHAIQLSGREVFDGTDLVRHSIKLGKDIIVVGINYRVGPLGFLASTQLADYNRKFGEDICNYGLHDQRRALEWLSEHLAGFGGDPDNITIQGTSAGASSCHYQSIFPERKFKRAILASGTFFGLGALPLDRHQAIFDRLSGIVAPGVSSDDALQSLLLCNSRELTHSTSWTVCHPLIDGSHVSRSLLSGDSYVDGPPEIMVGFAAFEDELADLFINDPLTMKPKSDAQILESFKSIIMANQVIATPETFPFDKPDVLQSYDISSAVERPSNNLKHWSRLIGNLLFDITSVYTATTFDKHGGDARVWLYRYDATNTYPKSHSYRVAHHGVNDLFLFNVAPEHIPLEDQPSWNATVERTQRVWIDFANGESPWTPWRHESSVETIGAAGPIYTFADNGQSRLYDTMEECVGSKVAQQYQSLLRSSRLWNNKPSQC